MCPVRSFVVVLALIFGFGAAAQADPYKLVMLPSGKQIKAISIGKVFFSEGSPGLMLKYQTDLQIDDVPALQKEAEDVWALFRIDVERAGLVNGIISASTPAEGLVIMTSKSYNFVYVRGANGQWSRVPNKASSK